VLQELQQEDRGTRAHLRSHISPAFHYYFTHLVTLTRYVTPPLLASHLVQSLRKEGKKNHTHTVSISLPFCDFFFLFFLYDCKATSEEGSVFPVKDLISN